MAVRFTQLTFAKCDMILYRTNDNQTSWNKSTILSINISSYLRRIKTSIIRYWKWFDLFNRVTLYTSLSMYIRLTFHKRRTNNRARYKHWKFTRKMVDDFFLLRRDASNIVMILSTHRYLFRNSEIGMKFWRCTNAYISSMRTYKRTNTRVKKKWTKNSTNDIAGYHIKSDYN